MRRTICPALLFLGSLVLFLCTLAPTVTFVDSGELIVTARNLGVAHPPGFPLYLLVAHLATLLPIGNIAQRVHIASAFCAALAVALLYLVTTEAVLAWQRRFFKRNLSKARAQEKHASLSVNLILIPGLVSGCLGALSRTLWLYATVAEVYTLNALLILLVFLFVLRWRNRILDLREYANPNTRRTGEGNENQAGASFKNKAGHAHRLIYLAAFVFGLALGVHHVTVVLTLPALAWLVYATEGWSFFRSRRLLAAAAASLAGAAIYVYLPLAAARAPVLNWGNPNTVERFWSHVTGKQYLSNFSLSPDQFQREASFFLRLVFREFGWQWLPVGIVLAGIGIFSLYKRDRVLLGFLALIIIANLLFTLSYEIDEDKDAYYLPLFFAAEMAAGFGAYEVFCAARKQKIWLAAGIVLLAPITALAGNLRVNARQNYYLAEDYVNNVLNSISPEGLLLTGDWQLASPLLYFREILHQRQDVTCIDVLLLRRSWYYGYLELKYPTLVRQSRDQINLFMEDLLHWEKDPDAYKRDPALNQRIDMRYRAMIQAFIQNHFSIGSVYATEDVVLRTDSEGGTLAQSLLESYQIVPQGLVFQFFADRAFHRTELPQLMMRGLTDPSPVVKEDRVVRQKIIPVYVTMLVNCGRAFQAHGENGRAIEAYRQAWAIDSSLVLARNLFPPDLLSR